MTLTIFTTECRYDTTHFLILLGEPRKNERIDLCFSLLTQEDKVSRITSFETEDIDGQRTILSKHFFPEKPVSGTYLEEYMEDGLRSLSGRM